VPLPQAPAVTPHAPAVSSHPPAREERDEGFIDRHLPKIIAVLLAIATAFSGLSSNRADYMEEEANELKITIDTLERTAKAEELAARQYAAAVDDYRNQVVLLRIENGKVGKLREGYEEDIGVVNERNSLELDQVNKSYVVQLAAKRKEIDGLKNKLAGADKKVKDQITSIKSAIQELGGTALSGDRPRRGEASGGLSEPLTIKTYLEMARAETLIDDAREAVIDLRRERKEKEDELRDLRIERRDAVRDKQREWDAEIMEKRLQQKRLDDDIAKNEAKIEEIEKLITKYEGMLADSSKKAETSYEQTQEKVEEANGLREKADRLMRVPLLLSMALFLLGFASNSDKRFFKVVFTVIGLFLLGFSGLYFMRIMRAPI